MKLRPENTKTWTKGKGSIGHQQAECTGLKIEDRLYCIQLYAAMNHWEINTQ